MSIDTQVKTDIAELSINTIRTLSMDAVQKAKSGHPGTPMALAPAAYVLWKKIMKHNPKNPKWFDRDRFVLSCGHASMLIYSMLHLTGYDVSLDDIKNFRQWGSKTAGHPEYHDCPGVETTTGPLGQGISNAVGMALAEAHMAAKFNKKDLNVVDHYTYAFCSDGDLMEGISHEASSLAGHLGLGKLICLFDDNKISIEGSTDLAFTEDVAKRYEAYGWQVINIGDKSNDLEALEKAFLDAKADSSRPSLIIVRTHIGYGSPNKQDTAGAHGAPLGEDEIKLTKEFYGLDPSKDFHVPEEALKHMQECIAEGSKSEEEWNELCAKYKDAEPQLAEEMCFAVRNKLPENWEAALPKITDDSLATRSASGKVLNAIAPTIKTLIGGSADLAPSNNSFIKENKYLDKNNMASRNIAWGVREHAMAAACNGMILHGGVRPYAATFFVFTDYCRASIRLAALMKQPVIYIMTHDSIGLGEDGPTHQPIEHLASLRAMPNLDVLRPADANETVYAWKSALERQDGPTMLVLTRQNLKTLDRNIFAKAENTLKGAYIVSAAKEKAQAQILATGSEVEIAIEAKAKLEEENIYVDVVSMPSWELFERQSQEYKNSVINKELPRIAIEAASDFGWAKYTGENGNVIAIKDSFGASAPYQKLYEEFGLTTENLIKSVKSALS